MLRKLWQIVAILFFPVWYLVIIWHQVGPGIESAQQNRVELVVFGAAFFAATILITMGITKNNLPPSKSSNTS